MAAETSNQEEVRRSLVSFEKEDQEDTFKVRSRELVPTLVEMSVKEKDDTIAVPSKAIEKSLGKVIRVPVKQVKSHVPSGRGSARERRSSEYQEGKQLEKSAVSRPVTDRDFATYGRGKDPSPEVNGTFMDKKVRPTSPVQSIEEKIYMRKYAIYQANKQSKNLEQSKIYTAISPADDVQILKSIFNQLGEKSQGVVNKTQVWSYLHENPYVSEMLKLTELTNSEDFMNHLEEGLGDTNDSFELDDFLGLYRRRLSKKMRVKRHRIIQKPVIVPETSSEIALSPVLSQLIFDVFSTLDSYSEQYITREDFLSALREHAEIQENLSSVAVHLPTGDKTLGDIIQVIEDEGDVKEYITLSELKTYLNFNYVSAKEEEANESALNEIELEKDDIRVLYSVFLSLPSETENATRTKEFVRKINEEPQYAELKAKKAREPKGISKYPSETIEQLLTRIETSEGDTLTWNVLLAYLTRRGEPLKLIQEEEEEQESYYEEVSIEEPLPSIGQSDTFSDSLPQETEIPQPQGNIKATVPQPFSFEKRQRPKTIRQRKLEEMLEEYSMKEMEEMNHPFHAREVPLSVKEPKYDSIKQSKEERREKNKLKTHEEEQELSKPFSFASKGTIKTPVEEPQQQSQFKANPVPLTSKVLLLDQIAANELDRKLRIAQRAEASLLKAKLPPRMEEAQPGSKQPVPISQKMTFRARSFPDFPTLHGDFQQQLELKKPPSKQTKPQPFHLSESKLPKEKLEEKKPIPRSAEGKQGLKHFKAAKESHKKAEQVKELATRVEYEGVIPLNHRTSTLKSAIEDIWESF